MRGWAVMGTSTSKYVRKKKTTEEQKKRSEKLIEKLDEINKKK